MYPSNVTRVALGIRVRRIVFAQINSLDVVHGSHGRLGFCILREPDEAETTATTSIAVLHHGLGQQSGTLQHFSMSGGGAHSFLNLTEFGKFRAKGDVVSVPGQAAWDECQRSSLRLVAECHEPDEEFRHCAFGSVFGR